MAFPSQFVLPYLWLLVQRTIGGNKAKQQLATRHYNGQPRVLEIGCSVGNVSDAFRSYPGLDFTGIDIDPVAIAVARRRFRAFPNFSFMHSSLAELASARRTFEYVLFAGVLHHVNDDGCSELLLNALRVVTDDGLIVVSEPEAIRASDNRVFRIFYKLEQGAFLRSRGALELLIITAGASIESSEECLISPGIVQRPYVARFNLICAKPLAHPVTPNHWLRSLGDS